MTSKFTDETLFGVIHFCVNFLYDKFPHERGLFRSTVSQTQVREMQSQIVGNNLKSRDDVDPHIIAEVIQISFKSLSASLLHEVYSEIVASELAENDFDGNRSIVQVWMKKIPEHKYFLFFGLFKLLAKLSELEESDSGVVQLAYSIAPTICRPLNHAFMSIRHMEDLKKIRPVVLFLIENFSEVIGNTQPPVHIPPAAAVNSDLRSLPDVVPKSINVDLKVDDTKLVDQGQGFPFIKPNLLVMIPSLHVPVAESSGSEADTENEKSHLVPVHSYSDGEWKILQALVNSRVSLFMDLDEKESTQLMNQEASGDTYHTIMQAWSARVSTSATNSSPSKADLSSVPVSPSSSSIGSLHRQLSLQKSSARRSHRRKMVAECKGLRAQISNFEQEFAKVHNRQPKSQERGNMQSTYVKYRELKREIRDSAATDLQRVIRGYLTRKALGFRIGRKLSPQNRYSSTSSGVMTKLSASLPTSTTTGDQSSELISKYRDCAENKRDLKRKLKKFDEDFMAQHSRAPKKSDKEVIRPMYQKYHEIKNQLESLKRLIQQGNIAIPDDLKEDFLQTTASGSGSLNDSKRGGDSDFETDDSKSSLRGRKNVTSDDDAGLFEDGPVKSVGISTLTNVDKNQYNVEALQLEKKNLHAYLKVYERDFNKTHGRPVTKSEDILPVANEYQRYKELKNLIKDLKG